MVDQIANEDHKCKSLGHVRVRIEDDVPGWPAGRIGARFAASIHCRNEPSYAGWAVVLVLAANTGHAHDGMQLLPDLAEVLPHMLARAGRTASGTGATVTIEHTVDRKFVPYERLTAGAALELAGAIASAVAEAPPGEHG